MRNRLVECLGCLIVIFGLVSCGNQHLESSADCASTLSTITVDIPNSVDLILSDMKLSHEGLPHGVPESYDWFKWPVSHAESIPPRFHAMIAWGQVYEDVCENPATNTRVQIRNIRAYALSKKDNQWHLLQAPLQVEGAAYLESFVPHISKPGNMRVESDGSFSVKAGKRFNFHFFPQDRAAIEPDDVVAVFTTVQARLIVEDPLLPDDRSKARYLLNMGADLWRDTTVGFDKEENNPSLGMGRFKYVTTGWQWFNMLYMAGGIDENAFRENPPPLKEGVGISQ